MYVEYFQSPTGVLRIEADDTSVLSVSFEDSPSDTVRLNNILIETVSQLAEYFQGSRKEFTVPVNPAGTEFQQRVWKQLQTVPFGKTRTYQSQAKEMGDVKAIRAVAAANGQNPIAIIIPCHRIIGSDGSLTGYAGGVQKKEWLLQHEGAIAPQLSIF